MSAPPPRPASPREEGELEDGELSDDSGRPDSPLPVRPRPSSRGPPHPQYRSRPPRPAILPRAYRLTEPYRPPPPPPKPDGGPRPSFWERSYDTLGRFRSRGRGGRLWERDRGGRSRPPTGRSEPPSRKPPKPVGRSPPRKSSHSSSKHENCDEESFEDLLLKYKQIKLELESIKKDEKNALKEQTAEPAKREEPAVENIPVPPVQPEASTTTTDDAAAVEEEVVSAEPVEEKPTVKAFQAFELKPLRQKLKPVAEQKKETTDEESKTAAVEDSKTAAVEESKTAVENDEATPPVAEPDKIAVTESLDSSADDDTNKKPLPEEEDLSELHLRLLALQSASKKWQQKEQLVMKEGKEKLAKDKVEFPKEKAKVESPKEKANIESPKEKATVESPKDKTRTNSVASRKVHSAAYAAKQALRRQQTKAWKKLQLQKAEEKRREEEEKKKQAEEEERRKREEEIRKIRDLSNHEEQYNRFMKLVGDKTKLNKSSDQKRAEKQTSESSGGIYQYDNYEEVAMDTDSETNSPGASPARLPYPPVGYTPSSLCVTDPYPSDVWAPRNDFLYCPITITCPTAPLPPPPLPPEEPEQPPKPPFADEEEEEEMLLREELLKSLANKRSVKSEEPSPPPSPPAVNNIMPVPRITLTSGSVNPSALRKNNTQIVRVLRPIRRVIKLPKHKSVVVTLNASDSDESDPEPPSPALGVFGGLESMIKEARRTVEASKPPKGPPISEKENDPLRTPEALPEDKKIEYRLLREEITSREKQKVIKTEQSIGTASPTNSDAEVDAGRKPAKDPKVSEAESRHAKQKILLLKDENLLKNLLQQEDKKKESIRSAELKIIKLTEQLQATEKFLNANKLFLKNLQEQISKVKLRVDEKKTVTLKYGEELARAKAVVSQELGKRKREPGTIVANKIIKQEPGSPKRQTAEAIALEKKRLQELEKEYALKIQKLKEIHSKKRQEQAAPPAPAIEEPPAFALPQPSLHDLSQDKITLDQEETEAEDEDAATSVKERRKSFRDSSSFTKPNLKHAELTPYKDGHSKPSKESAEGPELFMGLNIDELRRLQTASSDLLAGLLPSCETLLVSKDRLCLGKAISVDMDLVNAQNKQTDLKSLPFGPYRSPLLVFKSYRFSPYFRTKEKLLLSSVSYSNMIEPKTFFCHFDLTGTCNDDDCQWQHMRDCTLSRKQLFEDILSYNLDLIGCSEKSKDEEIMAATEKYVDKLFGVNRDRMSMDLMSVLLVSHVNESQNHTPPHTTCKEKRKWKPMFWKKPVCDSSSSDEDDATKPVNTVRPQELKSKFAHQDAVVTPEDIRYFTSETDDISNLEASALDNPHDIQLWIKLAYKCLNQNDGTSSECLDSSLNVLSRALEHNRDNTEIWSHYLKLFSKRGSAEEIREMCETAVEYAASYQIWWTFLNLETSFHGKDDVSDRTLHYLMQQIEEKNNSELLSLQCLEMLLYRVHLNLITGRVQNAHAILQNALKSPDEKSVVDHLTPQDRCLAWLSYIHLMEYNSLPAHIYDPMITNPSKIVNKEPFLIHFQSPRTDPAMLLALFEAAIISCSDPNFDDKEKIEVCLPLYKNLVMLHMMLKRSSSAVDLCNKLLDSWSDNCEILEALCSVYLQSGQKDRGLEVWITAFRNNPGNAQIFYNVCKFLVQQERIDRLPPIMDEFLMAFFEDSKQCSPADFLRYLLHISIPLDFKAPAFKLEGSLKISDLQTSYLWLVFCLWQSVFASAAEASDAYEAALGAVMQQSMLEKLWMDYLVFTNRKILESRSKIQDSKTFADLVHRCLLTVPSRHQTPFSTADYWTNYEFHNSVIYYFLSCVPRAQHSTILERFSSMMPANVGLALRVLKQELEDHNMQTVKMQSKMFTYNFPMCLPVWKIAIAVETFHKGHKEVDHLYQRALVKLPLCASLWKDQLLFEASEGGKTDNLRKLVSKCQEVGVSLDELLKLNTESKHH